MKGIFVCLLYLLNGLTFKIKKSRSSFCAPSASFVPLKKPYFLSLSSDKVMCFALLTYLPQSLFELSLTCATIHGVNKDKV
ncbi:uncharacterized protein RHIMIDRAFT_253998 [Rhizopus microsporus ATCC 52813]|uniref:Uncharacterized protein n=1 Tax=Rhizopus microsporus ATCC 52813 TaxID=1340429 RepID=A0A2G4T8X1_RHIZD|nr:uncharacterized protein RHIMIDRAFT_253998 [Rhizopus microsporus ATCC 52813]PHZ17462.1 hypothetical protein RHIMIDRAFT_253998 [Rhizopus microsporus ATCC 52813]